MALLASTFTPLSSGIGGLMIGSSAAIMMLRTGRILGVSGIVSNINEGAWRRAALGGMIVGGAVTSGFLGPEVWSGVSSFNSTGVLVPALSGALVGVGTSLGNGCTSGHGVCGLARLSKRSFVAVSTFMLTGMITASMLMRLDPVILLPYTFTLPAIPLSTSIPLGGVFGLGLIASSLISVSRSHALQQANPKTSDTVESILAVSSAATLFGSGLVISGMTNPDKVLAFLSPFATAGWDPSLAFVMGGALLVNTPVYWLFKKSIHALPSCNIPAASPVNLRLVVGSALFGVGWGLGGLCPGPAIVGLVSGTAASVVWTTTFALALFAIKFLLAPKAQLKKTA